MLKRCNVVPNAPAPSISETAVSQKAKIRFKDAVNQFMNSYIGSFNNRRCLSRRIATGKDRQAFYMREEFLVVNLNFCCRSEMLQEPNQVMLAVREWFVEKKEDSKMCRIYIEGRELETCRRMGQACCYFLAYVRERLSNDHPSLRGSDVEVLNVIRVLKKKFANDEGKFVNFFAGFYEWYARIPQTRVTALKLANSAYNIDRAEKKETSTMSRIISAGISYLVAFGFLPVGSRKYEDWLSRRIWNACLALQRRDQQARGGVVKCDKFPLTWKSLLERMLFVQKKEKNILKTPQAVQAWMMAFVLVGTGLRPGSVRTTKRPKGLCWILCVVVVFIYFLRVRCF